MKNNLKNKRALDTSNRKIERSTYDDDDEYEINRRSRSNENMGSPAMISFDNFQLKDSEKIVMGDRSLKSNDFLQENLSQGTDN